MAKKYAVIGSPIEHSKSPVLHRAAYRVIGVDWDYQAYRVESGQVADFVAEMGEDLCGVSVTMPLKEEAFRFASEKDKWATATGVANTLWRPELATWFAYNTDVFGIANALTESLPTIPKRVLVLGSGATAKSAVAAAASLGVKDVRVWARNSAAVARIASMGDSIGVKVRHERSLRAAKQSETLVISTLPAGAFGDYAAKLSGGLFNRPIRSALLDVAYAAAPGSAAETWAKAGQTVIQGIEMLIWQAVAQLRIFVNGSPDDELPNESAVVAAMRHDLELVGQASQ